jgi:sarcosine oxidase subunit gamma
MVSAAAERVNSLAQISRDATQVVDASLSVLPDAAKFIFRGRSSSWPIAAEAFGVELPQAVNRFSVRGARKAYCLGPDEWLLEAVKEDPGEIFRKLSEGLASHSCSLVDVSHRSDAFEISGRRSEYVLNHGCPLDLSEQQFPVGMCTRTLIGKSPVLLSRMERAAFQIDVWRSFSSYVWALLDEARREFSSVPSPM